MMDYFKTQYEKFYEGEDYYWGMEPADFLDEIIAKTANRGKRMKVLDIGCGEGKDAVYMAQKGYDVTAFDVTESGIRKTKFLATQRGVEINAFIADINTFEIHDHFDIIYSTGTIQYLQDKNIDAFFEKIKAMTSANGYNYFNVFVEKPFLELPQDWDKEETMWKTGDLFKHYSDWRIHKIDEVIFEDTSGGSKHFHCMDTILAEKPLSPN